MPKLLTQFFPRHIQAPLCWVLKRLTPFLVALGWHCLVQFDVKLDYIYTLLGCIHCAWISSTPVQDLNCFVETWGAHTLLGSFIWIFIPSSALVCVHLYCEPGCVYYKHGQTPAALISCVISCYHKLLYTCTFCSLSPVCSVELYTCTFCSLRTVLTDYWPITGLKIG